MGAARIGRVRVPAVSENSGTASRWAEHRASQCALRGRRLPV